MAIKQPSTSDSNADRNDPEPIDCRAEAELDYNDPDRPLSISIDVPADVVDDPDEVLESVSISAKLVDE